jgi:hypothetical protein
MNSQALFVCVSTSANCDYSRSPTTMSATLVVSDRIMPWGSTHWRDKRCSGRGTLGDQMAGAFAWATRLVTGLFFEVRS